MEKYIEIRTIHYDDLWALCNKQEWYTKGTNSEYEDLLLKASDIDNVTTEDIHEIAKNIYNHSDYECDYYFMEEEQIIESVMFLINRQACTTVFAKLK